MSLVYIACSSTELPRYYAARDALVAAGLALTLDWSLVHRPTAELSDAERHWAAAEDFAAIRRADVLLVLAPSVRSDALVEMGYALGCARYIGQHIVVAGPVTARGIFGACCDVEVEHDADALASVVAFARGRG